MLRKKIRDAAACAMGFVSFLSFACAVCVAGLCFDGHTASGHNLGLDQSQRGLLVITYALFSIGMTLWLVLGRMHKAESQASRDEPDDASRAPST